MPCRTSKHPELVLPSVSRSWLPQSHRIPSKLLVLPLVLQASNFLLNTFNVPQVDLASNAKPKRHAFSWKNNSSQKGTPWGADSSKDSRTLTTWESRPGRKVARRRVWLIQCLWMIASLQRSSHTRKQTHRVYQKWNWARYFAKVWTHFITTIQPQTTRESMGSGNELVSK